MKVNRAKINPLSYSDRNYRLLEQSGLVSSYVRMKETDLHILAPTRVEDDALQMVASVRRQLEKYIRGHQEFVTSMIPLAEDPSAPAIVQEMLTAGQAAGVGPMAAVAGAVAEAVGHGLIRSGFEDLIVENGGDIFIQRNRESVVAIFAGTSPLSNRVGIRLAKTAMPCGVCCSSGSIGHSLSLGKADAVVVVAKSTALADAAATRVGNEVDKGATGLEKALLVVREIKGVSGAAVVKGEQFGAWGEIEIIRL